MLVDLTSDDQELWSHFYEVARDWYLNYAEIWLTRAARADLGRLAEALRSSSEWRMKTGERWKDDFADFSAGVRDGSDLEQVMAFRGEAHMQCFVEPIDGGTDLRVELLVWPAELLEVSDDRFERMIEESGVPRMPESFPTVVNLARAVQEACDFKRVEFAMEGDRPEDAAEGA